MPLGILHKSTLASQQPAPISGSNHNTAITSITAAGVTANGYVAFMFDESTIAMDENGNEPTLRVSTGGPQGTLNRVTAQFFDADNQYAPSAVAPVDSEDIRRVGQELPGSLVVEGVTTFDQARRAVATVVAESLRGNPRGTVGDTGGTLFFEMETSFRVLHLRLGDICRLKWAKWDLDCLIRITAIQPKPGFGRWLIRGHYHNDLWYVDTFGQRDTPLTGTIPRDRLLRPSLPWHPGDDVAPWPDVALTYEYGGDGVAVPRLSVSGRVPVNSFSESVNAPVVPAQASGLITGGAIPAGSYHVALCGVDADGKYSYPSAAIPARVASGSAGSIVVAGLKWIGTAPTNVAVFAGPSPYFLSLQDWLIGAPTSVTLTTYSPDGIGVPDQEFDKLRVRAKRCSGAYGHAGIIGAEVAASTATTIQLGVPSPGLATNALAGYDVLMLGRRGSSSFPRLQFRVTSNTSDTLTVTGDNASGLEPLDVVIVMSRATAVGANWIEDDNWIGPFAPDGLTPNGEAGRLLRIVSGTGNGFVYQISGNTDKRITIHGEWVVQPDNTSRYIIEEPNWAATTTSSPYTNSDPASTTTLTLDVANLRDQALLLECSTLDGGGAESIEAYSPMRLIWLFGEPVRMRDVTEDYDVAFDDDNLLVDSTGGDVLVRLLPAAARPGRDLIIKHKAGSNTVTVQCAAGDTFDDSGATTRTVDLGKILIIAGKR